MKKNLLLCALVIFVASCSVVDALYSDGYEYVPPDKSFSIVFDAKPIVETKAKYEELPTPWGDLDMTEVIYPNRSSVQVVYYTDLPKDAVQGMDAYAVLEKIKQSRLDSLEEPEKYLRITRFRHLLVAGYPALAARVKMKPDELDNKPMKFVFAEYRSVLVGNRYYEVIIANREDYPTKTQINLFIDTFKVLK